MPKITELIPAERMMEAPVDHSERWMFEVVNEASAEKVAGSLLENHTDARVAEDVVINISESMRTFTESLSKMDRALAEAEQSTIFCIKLAAYAIAALFVLCIMYGVWQRRKLRDVYGGRSRGGVLSWIKKSQ